MPTKPLELQRFSPYNQNGPGGVGSTSRGLTHSLDYTKEGLAMDATQIPQRVIDRALSNIDIDPERGCWISRYSIGSHGYAQIGWQDTGAPRPTMSLVHRVAYAATRGPIPDGMTVDHMCKQKRCCNPNHLRLLTNYENGRRTRGRDWPVGQCINGHPNSHLEEISGHIICKTCRIDKRCPDCGTAIYRTSNRCSSCYHASRTKQGI